MQTEDATKITLANVCKFLLCIASLKLERLIGRVKDHLYFTYLMAFALLDISQALI